MRAAWEPMRGADAGPSPAPRQAGGLDDAQAQALQRAAWLRAMEQSQAAGWLDHALLPGGQGPAATAPQLFSAPHHDLRPPAAERNDGAGGGARADAGTPSADAPNDKAAPPPAAPRGANGAAGTAVSGVAGVAGAGPAGATTGADIGAAPVAPVLPAALSTAIPAMAPNGPASPGALLAAMSAAVREAAPALGIDVAAASLSVGTAPPVGPGWAGARPGASLAGLEPEAPEAAEAPDAASAAAEASAGDQAELRLHAEWLEHGVRIWIGADRRLDLDARGLTRLSEQLQLYCRARGAPLLALVCNGKRVALEAPGRRGAHDTGNADGADHPDQPGRVGDGAATTATPRDIAVPPLYTYQEQS